MIIEGDHRVIVIDDVFVVVGVTLESSLSSNLWCGVVDGSNDNGGGSVPTDDLSISTARKHLRLKFVTTKN